MLIPSANDAATALALHVGNGSTARFVSLMNAKARELGAGRHDIREPARPRRARSRVERARCNRSRPLRARSSLDPRGARRGRRTRSRAGSEFPTTDDLLASWPPLVGGKTGHTEDAGWSEAAAASRRGATVYGTVLGVDTREGRNDALRTLLEFGLDRYQRVAVDRREPCLRRSRHRVRAAARRARCAADASAYRERRSAAPRAHRGADDGRAAGARGRAAGTGRGLGG